MSSKSTLADSLLVFFLFYSSYLFYTAYVNAVNRNTVTIYTELERKVEEGKAFTSSKRFSLSSGSSIRILFNNKANVNVKIVAVEVNTEANVLIDIYDNVTVNVEGNAWAIRNLNLGSNYMTNVRIEDSGDYADGELIHQTIGYGGTKNFAVGSLSEVGEKVIIPSNNNFMIVITNDTTQEIKISVRFIFYEA